MPRFSSAVAISILGLSFAHGCASEPEEDDDDGGPSSTTGITNTGSGGTGVSTGGSGGSGGGQSSNGTGGGGTGPTLAEACPNLEGLGECGMSGLTAEPQPVNMLIVLDKSGSMDQDANGTQKWGAMKSALGSALREVADSIDFGLELYPTPHNLNDIIDLTGCGEAGNCCEMPTHGDMNVPITAGSAGVDAIVDTLDNTDPGGGTPTARALERALDYYANAGDSLEGDKYVLLATDGGPNCNELLECGASLCTYNLDGRDCSDFPNQNCCDMTGAGCVDSSNVVDRIEQLANNGIQTFVVGIPGSEAYSEFLDDFAEAGERPVTGGDYSYYRVEDVNSLTDVFREITISLVNTCEFKAPESTSTEPPDVIIKDSADSACRAIPRMSGAGGGAGSGNDDGGENWTYDRDSRTVTLLGEECERVKQGVERIDVAFDCSIIF